MMVFVEPGLVSLWDWKVEGPRIAQRYEEIAKETDEAALERLRVIQDRYRRLPINKERRPYLGDAALAHLGLPIARGNRSIVYVAVFPNRIDLLAPAYRNAKLITGASSIDDLP